MKKMLILISVYMSLAFTSSAFASRLFLPGLWQYTQTITTTVAGLAYSAPPMTSTYSTCIGNKFKPLLQKNPNMPADCPKPVVTIHGKTVITRFECSIKAGSEIKELIFEYFPNDKTMHMHGHIKAGR